MDHSLFKDSPKYLRGCSEVIIMGEGGIRIKFLVLQIINLYFLSKLLHFIYYSMCVLLISRRDPM